MRWFVLGEEGARLPWKEWDKAARDPEDMLASMALGEKAYRSCMRSAELPARREAMNTITAFAHLLHHMLDEIGEDRMLELRYVLQEDWMGACPGLWEPPTETVWPIGDDLRLEMLSLRHCLQRTVAPELLRLYWAGMTAAGRDLPVRSTGTPFPLLMLDKMRAEDLPPFLEQEEREGMAFLRSELTLSDRISIDDLEEVLARQSWLVRREQVFVGGHASGGGWFGRKEVRAWREGALRSCSLLIAFRVMFLASVTGESGPLRPSFPD